MSSNQILAEKLRSARQVVGFLNKKTEENSMDEDMLSYVFNTLNDAVAALLIAPPQPIVLAPPSQTLEEQVIASTKIDAATKKSVLAWTAERRAAHSAAVKAGWAAKKAQE